MAQRNIQDFFGGKKPNARTAAARAEDEDEDAPARPAAKRARKAPVARVGATELVETESAGVCAAAEAVGAADGEARMAVAAPAIAAAEVKAAEGAAEDLPVDPALRELAASGEGTLPPPDLPLLDYLADPTWRAKLSAEFRAPYFHGLQQFLDDEYKRATVFPPKPLVFSALNACPLGEVKVVILGQDPYHGPKQAHGLSFSVMKGVRKPPSLLNILKEVQSDTGAQMPDHGNLGHWAQQGVLLLNTVLTVRKATPNSHAKRGWEQFTDAVIRTVNQERRGVVFLLWGKPAQTKAKLITAGRHHILQTVHPSPLSASKGFFGCKHFSAANELLKKQGLPPIDWSL